MTATAPAACSPGQSQQVAPPPANAPAMGSDRSTAEEVLRRVPASVWVVVWVLLNVSLTLMNKAVYKFGQFKLPLTLSAIHNATSSLFTYVLVRRYHAFPSKNLAPAESRMMLYFSALFCANIVLGNMSLYAATVALVQVVRSIIPGMTMLLSVVFLGKMYSLTSMLFMVPICLGTMMTIQGDVDATLLGGFILATGCLLSSMKVVACNKFLVGSLSMHPIDLLDKTTTASFLFLLPFIFFAERDELVAALPSLLDPHVALLVFGSGVIAFFLNISNFFTNQATSPVVLTIAGNVKQAASIFLSIIIFDTPVTFLVALGIAVTLLSCAGFSYVRMRETQEEKERARRREEERRRGEVV